MMKFSEHPDHNRNISIEFDDAGNKSKRHGLPEEIVIQVRYLDGKPCGDAGKAIRLDNEVMHLLKASSELLRGCKVVLDTIEWALEQKNPAPGSTDPCVMACQDLRETLRPLITKAEKTTY